MIISDSGRNHSSQWLIRYFQSECYFILTFALMGKNMKQWRPMSQLQLLMVWVNSLLNWIVSKVRWKISSIFGAIHIIMATDLH